MTLKRTLTALVNAILDEAASNPEFYARMEAALNAGKPPQRPARPKAEKRGQDEKRKGGRRTPAVLDPVEIGKQGEDELRLSLNKLDLEKLLDIVAEYGMDPGKLVMKWKDRERVIDRIVEVALSRATKGDAFRKD